jgi:hypothetical protein
MSSYHQKAGPLFAVRDRYIVHVFLEVCLPELIMCESKIRVHFERLAALSYRFVIRMRKDKSLRQIRLNDKR